MYISEERRKLLIIAGSAVLLLLLDIFLIIVPLVNKTADLKHKIVSAKKNITTLDQEIASIANTKSRLEVLKSEQEACEKKFPKEEEVPSLLSSISTIAAASGIDIIALKPVRAGFEEGVKAAEMLFHEIPLEIVAKGGYHQIGQFTYRLETLDRFIVIKDIEIVRDNTTPRRHNFRLLVSTYISRM